MMHRYAVEAGHVDRPRVRLTASSLSHRGVVCLTAHKKVGGPRPRANATGALFVPLEHPMLLGSGHGSSSLRVAAGTRRPV